jgi:hypothetical protein
VQRAKTARERAELEEQQRDMKATEERLRELQDYAGDDQSGGKPKRRWLARLGLNRERDED